MMLVLRVATRMDGYFEVLLCLAGFLSYHFAQGCPTDWDAINGDCYRVFSQSQAFDNANEARDLCLKNGGDLAVFPDYATQELVAALVQSIPMVDRPSHAYIGLTDIDVENMFMWIDNTSLSYNNFTAPEPNNNAFYNGEDCVTLSDETRGWIPTDVVWKDVPCCFQEHNITGVICQRPPTTNVTVADVNNTILQKCFGSCPDGWKRHGDSCYEVFDSSITLNNTYEARNVCLSHGADLPSVYDVNTEHHIASIMRSKSHQADSVYIGVNDVTNETEFRYNSGNLMTNESYSNWENGVPLSHNATSNDTYKNCVVLTSSDSAWNTDSGRKWRDIECCTDKGVSWVMCEKPMSGANITVSDDDNIFAKTCFGSIDECSSDPCQNNATCEDMVLKYHCACVLGYDGDNCENMINYCDSNPCQHGTCEPYLNGYNCSCHPAFSGDHCDELIDPCLWNPPCLHNSTCQHNVTDYNCTCGLGYTGVHCETNIDECDNTTCLNNGTCVDEVGFAWCSCDPRFTGDHCQQEIACIPVIPVVANSSIVNNTGAVANGYIVYQCNPGHKFPDMETENSIACLETGWNTTLESCSSHCDYLPTVANSVIEGGNTAVGNTVNYTCETGYMFEDNSTFLNITCQDNGNWTVPPDEVPQCEVVTCPELPEWGHQFLDTRNNTYNTTVTFWCDVGYLLHDNTTARTIKCLADGEWTANLPPCNPVRCPYIHTPIGSTTNTTNNTYNTYARYQCDPLKRMRDGATYRIIKCDATGEWSDNVTDCGTDRCFPLPYVANATPSTTDALFDTRVELTCIKGHKFDGDLAFDAMTCNPNGRWAPILSSCEPVYCNTPPTMKNGLPDSNNTLYGTILEYLCDKGHYYDIPSFSNTIYSECLEDQTWNDTSIPNCWPIVCEIPPDIINGTRMDPPNFNYSQQVDYECEDGFKFIDGRNERTITCTEFGVYDESDVSCRKERCDPVPNIIDAIPDTTNTSWWTNVTYGCRRGYEWPDNKTTHHITCENTGMWNQTTGFIPCTIKECPPVPEMNFADVNGSDHVFDTYIQYDCDIGYKFPDNETSKVRLCSDEGKWEPPNFPTCIIKHCPKLPDVENATRASNETQFNTTVWYDCLQGYQFTVESNSKYNKPKHLDVMCTENETWTEIPPPCEVVFCPPLPAWSETNFSSYANDYLEEVDYNCKEGFVFEDEVEGIKDPKLVKEHVSEPRHSLCAASKQWEPPIGNCIARESAAAILQGLAFESKQSVPIGTVACSLMCLMLAGIILLDLNKLMNDGKIMKANIESMLKRRRGKVSDSSASIKESSA